MGLYNSESKEPGVMRFGRIPTFRETEKAIFNQLLHTKKENKLEPLKNLAPPPDLNDSSQL